MEQCDLAAPRTSPAPSAAERNAARFASLYEAHGRAVYYFALRLLGDPTQAEDATHDVFLRAWRKFGDFREEASPRSWLYRITINHCQNLMKSWHRRHVIAGVDDAVWETSAAPAESPLRAVENKELGQRIQKTLDQLPEAYRVLLLLVADEDLSYDDMAALTGQTTDAVRGKLFRARRAFAAVFAKTA